MEGDNTEPEFGQQNDNNVEIKKEPRYQPAQLSSAFGAGEVIDLLSSNNEQDDHMMVGVSTQQADEMTAAAISANVVDTDHTIQRSAPRTFVESEEMAAVVISANEVDINQTVQPSAARTSAESEESGTNELSTIKQLQSRFANKFRTSKKQDTTDDPFARFKEAEKIYNGKKKAGALSIEDEIAAMKRDSEIQAMKRKKEADEEYDRSPTPSPGPGPGPGHGNDDDTGLFVSEAPAIPRLSDIESDNEPAPRKRKHQADESDEERPAKKRGKAKGAGSWAKKGKKVAGQDYDEDDFEDVIQRAKKQTAEKAKPKAQSKAKGQAKKPVLAKGKGRGGKANGPDMTNLSSLFGNDIFEDTAATAKLAPQPNFRFDKDGSKRRDNALKQLIASVPEESTNIAKADRRYLDNAVKDFTGHASVKPTPGGDWLVAGMKSSLRHYQLLGTAFMRRRENNRDPPRGGILADEMGLGKTVMMLANIMNGRSKEKSKCKTTLIVASPSLVSQWDAEIRTHCQSQRENKKFGLGTVIQYRAGYRITSGDPLPILEAADIVLTTYHEVGSSYPKASIPPDKVTAQQKDVWWREHYEKNRGPLHRIRFLRVVLDEAQAIKNHMSHTSLACRALDSRHHWAITGTPVLNTIKEFYPYFKFLREPNTGSYKIFKENFCHDGDDGREKLHVFLRKLMIRRTHLDRLFNARLLDLPPPREHTLWLEFNEVERSIYEIVKNRFIEHINSMAKKDGFDKQFKSVWAMILRLRQICGHILLVQNTFVDLATREDFEKLNSITEDEGSSSEEGAALLVHLRNVLKSCAGAKSTDTGIGSAVLTENEMLATGVINIDDTPAEISGHHGRNTRFRKYLDVIHKSDRWEDIRDRASCHGCRELPMNPHITSCGHIYCFVCLQQLQHDAARRGHDSAKCGYCGQAYNFTKPLEDEFAAIHDRGTSKSSRESPKKKQHDGDMEDWLNVTGEVLPSAKTRAAGAQIRLWLDEEPDCKIIVYTLFLPLARVLERVCRTEGWGFCRYNGTMSHESRDKSIIEFGNDPSKKILIASLKAGGLGLNLTMASRVLLLDPWWNQATEQQAFCRVFRIGQEKETQMTRLVVKSSIDEAMMRMKQTKKEAIDEVLASSKANDKLSVHDLMRLFGKVEEDEQGRPFIFAEGGDEFDNEEHLRLANVDEEDEEQFMGNEE